MFQFVDDEAEVLRSRIATSKEGRGGRRYLSRVFTESLSPRSRCSHFPVIQLTVASDYQGRGPGRRILSRVVKRLSDMGYDGLSLRVSRDAVG
ncbi:MAG TPA: GNAT family N-acetyltransferase [Vicinamibacteria bacterium]